MLAGFDESTNTPGAQKFAYRAATFKNTHTLQVGAKSPPGRPQGEASIVPKGGGFSTVFTFSHEMNSFSAKMQLIKTSL